jgi:hypothetical protein
MPKSETIDEFAALMAEAMAADAPEVTKLAVAAPVEEKAKPDVVKPDDKQSRREPVAKNQVEFDGCPFQASVAVEKGYLNLEFTRSSRAFLYGEKLEQVVRFFQQHGDAFIAKAKAAGLK